MKYTNLVEFIQYESRYLCISATSIVVISLFTVTLVLLLRCKRLRGLRTRCSAVWQVAHRFFIEPFLELLSESKVIWYPTFRVKKGDRKRLASIVVVEEDFGKKQLAVSHIKGLVAE